MRDSILQGIMTRKMSQVLSTHGSNHVKWNCTVQAVTFSIQGWLNPDSRDSLHTVRATSRRRKDFLVWSTTYGRYHVDLVLFPVAMTKHPDFRGKGFIWLRVPCHHPSVRGTWSSQTHHTQSEAQRSESTRAQQWGFVFSFLFHPKPSPWNGVTHVQGGSSSYLN